MHIWLAWRGRHLFQAGRLDDGRANLDAALAMADVGGANVANAAALLTLGRIGLHTGDDRLVATAHQLGAERLDLRLPSMRQSLNWLRALEAAAHGDPARALAYLTTGDDDEPGNGLPSLPRDITDDTQLVRIALAAGDRARALDTVERAERRAADHPATATMAGVAAHARGCSTATPTPWQLRSNATARRAPLALASALEDAGSHAATGGHHSTAVQWLGEAFESYVHLGATQDAARTRRKLRDLGVRRRIGPAAAQSRLERVDRIRAAGRPACRPRPDQPPDRRAALPLPAHRLLPTSATPSPNSRSPPASNSPEWPPSTNQPARSATVENRTVSRRRT